jgi:ABC-type Mn2+/Zn2+ transport system ATPase subunit
VRIGLARCIYSNADVFLLDDPLASVDAFGEFIYCLLFL